jgi:succinate dehydrogenase/fumarate reductase flavoprotein subunit
VSAKDTYIIEKLSADVVVIGGGLAGAVAALQAREQGASVIVLEKGNTYRSGNAGSGLDHIYSYVPPVHETVGYTRDLMKQDMKELGHTSLGLAKTDITEYFVDVSYERILSLENYGINFRYSDSHLAEGFRLVPQFHSIPTSFHFEGRDVKVKLTEAMMKAGVTIVNHAEVVEILTDKEKRAAGAIAVSTRAEKLFVAEGKTTILATTSGASRLGAKGSPTQRYFDGPSATNAGFGITLALNAGAELANLELFITNGGLGFKGFGFTAGAPGGTWWPAARVVDDDGNVIVDRVVDYDISEPDYLKKNVEQMRRFGIQKVSMGEHMAQGRQLYVDLQEATDEEVEYIKWSMFHEGQCWLYLQHLADNNIDLKKVKIPYYFDNRVGISASIDRNSGVFVDKYTRSTVERLYAAGDITGGAGMIASAPFAVVFGYEAGLQAAAKAKEIETAEHADVSQLENVLKKIDLLKGGAGEPWQNTEQALRSIISVFGVYPLSDSKIDSALTLFAGVKRDLRLTAKNPHEIARGFEVLSLIETAQAIFTAAKNRKENIGFFKRRRDERNKIYGERVPVEGGKLPEGKIYTLYKDPEGEFSFKTYITNQK